MLPLLLSTALATAPDAAKDSRVYELRVYYAPEGKLDALNARFRDHTCKLFEKHGITNVGYWMPAENADRRLIYVVAHASREQADKNWKAFVGDADWKKAAAESEKNGKLVSKIERCYLTATDFSPKSVPAGTGRTFELRTYIATPKNLEALNSRFRDHTCKLFEKHGMTNVGYFNYAPGEKLNCGKLLAACSASGKADAECDKDACAADSALVYLLAHASADAAKASFDAFRKDPTWLAAREASEKKAGGLLTVKDGVKSLMLTPTDYSPMK
jgi:hypothetical protein